MSAWTAEWYQPSRPSCPGPSWCLPLPATHVVCPPAGPIKVAGCSRSYALELSARPRWRSYRKVCADGTSVDGRGPRARPSGSSTGRRVRQEGMT